MINFIVNTSDEYAVYAGVMLLSLYENNKKHKFHIYIFSTSISDKHYNDIKNLSEKYGDEVSLIRVDEKMIDSLPIKFAYHSINVYLRVLAPDLLPKSVHKFIYMDCDIIINGDIEELWNTDVENVALAATKDLPRFTPLYRKNLSLGDNGDYFNSGVMVVNADYWRMNNVASAVFKFAEDNPDKIIACDQDAMNAILKGQFKLISRKWNVYPDVFFEKPDLFEEEYAELEDIREHPNVIHFLYIKAWFEECRHPYKWLFKEFYEKYTKYTKSPFTPVTCKHKSILQVSKSAIKHLLYKLHVKHAYDIYDKRFVNNSSRFPS